MGEESPQTARFLRADGSAMFCRNLIQNLYLWMKNDLPQAFTPGGPLLCLLIDTIGVRTIDLSLAREGPVLPG
jgi:hypothetical protein